MEGGPGAGRAWRPDRQPLVLAGEPRLAYQPVVDLSSGRLLGFEALLRWHHPTEGVILPKLLIPWAEANGDIFPLGRWVLEEGCRQAVAWPSSVQLAVNCSIVQLRAGAGSTAVRHALEGSGLSPDRLTVEVTEHALADEQAAADLRAIAAVGVQLSVDDVGTSWTSFDLLRRLAVDTVKIDESFVTALEEHEGIHRMVVESVVHLAHSAGMSTVAEGVETEMQARIVRDFDSDAAQGYFFSPPLTVDDAAALARQPDRFSPPGLVADGGVSAGGGVPADRRGLPIGGAGLPIGGRGLPGRGTGTPTGGAGLPDRGAGTPTGGAGQPGGAAPGSALGLAPGLDGRNGQARHARGQH